jgi:hypothetical protein
LTAAASDETNLPRHLHAVFQLCSRGVFRLFRGGKLAILRGAVPRQRCLRGCIGLSRCVVENVLGIVQASIADKLSERLRNCSLKVGHVAIAPFFFFHCGRPSVRRNEGGKVFNGVRESHGARAGLSFLRVDRECPIFCV